MNEELIFVKHHQFPLWDFGWCSILQFKNTTKNKDIRIILDSKYYKMTYIKPFEMEKFEDDIHGPFIKNKIKETNFNSLDIKDFSDEIKSIFEDREFNKEPDEEQKKIVHDFIEKIDINHIYKLNLTEKNKEFVHEIGWVLIVFKEYLIFGNNNEDVFVMVFGYD